jgi:hypothetical protein
MRRGQCPRTTRCQATCREPTGTCHNTSRHRRVAIRGRYVAFSFLWCLGDHVANLHRCMLKKRARHAVSGKLPIVRRHMLREGAAHAAH